MTSTATIHKFPPKPSPGASQPATKDLLLFVVAARRGIRRAIATLDAQRHRGMHYRRRARLLREGGSPFDASRIAALEDAAAAINDACKPLRESLKTSGRLLVDCARLVDAGTTLAQRCEILNVNMADRTGLTESDGLLQIVFGHGLEDSAERRNAEQNDGPLFQAMRPVFVDFLTKSKEGQKLGDSLFEPGGLFAGVPMHTQASDGAMKRLPPRLHVVPNVLPPAGSV